MFEKPDPSKLRNSTLIIGIILIAISFAQIKLDLSKSVTFLGLPILIENQNVLSYSLIGISVYYLFRYWFYSMRWRGTWAVRADIFEEFSTIEDGYNTSLLASREDVLDRFAKLNHSGIKYENVRSHKNEDDSWLMGIKNPKKYSFMTLCRDIDFVAPVLINIAALFFAFKNLI